MQTLETTIESIKADQGTLLGQVENIVVNDEASMNAAAEILSKVKERAKLIETRRKEYVQPLNDQVKKINSDFKAAAEPYLQIESIIKKAIGSYVDEQRRLASEEQRRLDKQRSDEAKKLAEQNDISQRKALSQVEK